MVGEAPGGGEAPSEPSWRVVLGSDGASPYHRASPYPLHPELLQLLTSDFGPHRSQIFQDL
jgi:hypothetical protein